MRAFRFAVALIALLGWAVSAQAGTVTQKYNISKAWGSTGKTVVHLFFFTGYLPFTGMSIMGTLNAAVYTANSTFTKSTPPSSAMVHLISNKITGTGSNMGGSGTSAWTITGSVKAAAAGSTLCHVGASGMLASCSGTFGITTRAHCSGPGCTTAAPGNWGGTTTMFSHTQMWQAKSLHLGTATISHTNGSNHYLKSFQVKLAPPGAHLASSNDGYQTFHLGAKLSTVHTPLSSHPSGG